MTSLTTMPSQGTHDIDIFPAITVTPATVILPWLPGQTPSSFEFHATGGSGAYEWGSRNPKVAVSTINGAVNVHGAGVAFIRATDKRSARCFGEAEVIVALPAQLRFLPTIVEAVVGTELNLLLAVLDADNRVFSDCRYIHPVLTITNTTFFKLNPPEAPLRATPGYCLVVTVRALLPGTTRVIAKLGEIKAEILIYAHTPLRLLLAGNLLTYGASTVATLDGGPGLRPGTYTRTLVAGTTPDTVRIIPERTGAGAKVTSSYPGYFYPRTPDIDTLVPRIFLPSYPGY